VNNIIDINRRFNDDLVSYVKSRLKEISNDEKEIIFRINSFGGSNLALQKIKGFMYFMGKYKGYKTIGQAIHAESAAFLLFLNCRVRQVAPGSVGIIHFPVPRGPMDDKVLESLKKDIIEFIMRRTKMTEQQIISLENIPLSRTEMLDYGIATEKIPIIR